MYNLIYLFPFFSPINRQMCIWSYVFVYFQIRSDIVVASLSSEFTCLVLFYIWHLFKKCYILWRLHLYHSLPLFSRSTTISIYFSIPFQWTTRSASNLNTSDVLCIFMLDPTNHHIHLSPTTGELICLFVRPLQKQNLI